MNKKFASFGLLLSLLLILNIQLYSQWQQTSGPEGGSVYALGSNGSSNIFLAPNSIGVYRSADNGSHWSASGLQDKYIFGFFFKGNYVFAKDANMGLYRSVDNGNSWNTLNFPDLAWCETVKGNYIFIGTPGNIYRSSDNGSSWTLISNLYVNSLGSNNNYVFAGGYGMVHVSSDNGNNWVSYNTGLASYIAFNSFVSINSNIFANASGNYGVYKSSNNGMNWSLSGLDSLYVNNLFKIGTTVYAVAGKSDCSMPAGIYMTENNGKKWNLISSELDLSNVLSFTNNSNYLFLGFPYGVSRYYIKNDDWRIVNTGLKIMDVSGLAKIENDFYAGNIGAGIFYSDNNGDKWTDYNISLNNLNVYGFAIEKTKYIVYAYTDDGVYYTSPKIQKWTPKNNGLEDKEVHYLAVSDKNLYAGCYNSGLYRSTDGGNNWFFSGLAGRISGIAIGNNVIYAGTRNTHSKPWGILHKSTNGGSSWSDSLTGLPGKPLNAIIAKGNTVFAGMSEGLFRSTDSGNNWVKINIDNTDSNITALCSQGNNIVAGTYSGVVCISTDNGNSWTSISKGLINRKINCLAADNDYIYAGLSYNSVWRYKIRSSDILTSIETKEKKSVFILEQNIPNPFNPVTKISFSIPDNYSGLVTLKIFDVAGKEVSTLVNNVMNGNKVVMDVKFDGSKFSSGVYFYKLTAGNFSDIKKMILIK